jgi:UDP-N-acetylmuramoyl-tripeptide--D-alanyl-D-alanine ligase
VSELAGLGRVDAAPDAEWITGVEIDSRRISSGDLFVAIGRGADFAGEALGRGAAAVLVPDEPFAAMAALGRVARTQTGARVVGITGSAGKTSTKDILAALCRPHARTVASEGGHNNELGLPLTLTRTQPDTEVVLAEMGMRGLGQIAELCEIARPVVGLITGIGPVHLELLGTVERVARAKAEVIAALPPGGVAVVPANAPELEPYLDRADVEIVRFGEDGDVALERFDPPLLAASVAGERVELRVPFTAAHQAGNALGALAAYRALGLPLDRVGEGAAAIAFSPWRCEEVELPDGTLVINDAYNANPDSMRAALAHLHARADGRRTVAVLGEMAELGADAPRYHREVDPDVDVLVAVGGLARAYLEGPAREAHWVATRDEAVALLEELVRPEDAILVKASRAVGLEVVAEALVRVRA